MENPEKQPPPMLDPATRHKDFTCKLCGEARSYGSWEDTEIHFAKQKETVHLGCLMEYSQELTLQAKLALENLKSGIQSLENCDLTGVALKSLKDAQTNLQRGLHL